MLENLEQAIAEIEIVEDQLRVAMLEGDVASLDALLSDTLIFTNQGGARLTKLDDLAAHRSGLLRIADIDVADRHIRIIAAGAIVTQTAKLRGDYDGRPFSGTFAYTRVWINSANGWKVEGAHCSAVA